MDQSWDDIGGSPAAWQIVERDCSSWIGTWCPARAWNRKLAGHLGRGARLNLLLLSGYNAEHYQSIELELPVKGGPNSALRPPRVVYLAWVRRQEKAFILTDFRKIFTQLVKYPDNELQHY